MKNAKKSPFIRVLCAVLSAVTLITSLQTAALAAEQMIEPELSSYLIEFADSDSAAEFESNADIQTLSVNETLVAAELTENHAQALSESDEVVTLEADIIVKANEGEESQEETALEETTPEECEEENTEEGTQEETEETEEATESVTWSTKALCAQNLSETGEGVKVAVLDSGLDFYSEVAPAGIVDFVDPEFARGDDMTGHGTAVSGIIAAPEDESGIIGIAPDAELYSVRVLDESNEAPISRIISGIDWCIENEVDIINMSFGTSEYSALLEEKIEEAAQAGILLIASAGNGESVQYPAKFTEVIAVGSVTSAMIKAEDSATGGELEFVAPGENVYSTSLLGGYGAFSGTSLASPHIAGAAAVLLGKDTTKSPEFIRALLAASCKTLGEAESYGNGIPDLAFALQIYDDFAQNYTDSTYQPPQNTGNPENFTQEDVYVVGEWSKDAHDTLADEFFDGTSHNNSFPKFIKATSSYCDTFFHDRIYLHGNDNYVVSAKLLYEIAVKFKNTPEGEEFNYKSYKTELKDVYEKNPLKPKSNTDTYTTLVESIGIMFNYIDVSNKSHKIYRENSSGEQIESFITPGADDFNTINEKKSVIVLGMFFHLIGDVYAHRAIVPPGAASDESRTSHGNDASKGENEGRYFVKSEFNDSCRSYFASASSVTNKPSAPSTDTKSKELGKLIDNFKEATSVYRIICLFEIVIWIIDYIKSGNNEERKAKAESIESAQEEIDLNLINLALNVPTNTKSGKFDCVKNGYCDYPCYSALKRLNGLGVLQFKDIKYFLKGRVDETEDYKEAREYYEDQAPGGFYYRRFMVSQEVVNYYFGEYFASTKNNERDFLPFHLISAPYDENIRKLNVKIDQYYNYLKDFHDGSKVLKSSTWSTIKDYSLFSFTTVIYNGSYFIDPDTYHSVSLSDGTEIQNVTYHEEPFPSGLGLDAEDFYYGGDAW